MRAILRIEQARVNQLAGAGDPGCSQRGIGKYLGTAAREYTHRASNKRA
jgi:hypothetical protein